MWREPFAKRRCLVLASDLYEWPMPGYAIAPTYEPEVVSEDAPAVSQDLFNTPPPVRPEEETKATEPIKRVFAITLTERGPFAFAGIWIRGSDPTGIWLEPYALVTTEPNELGLTC
jgi:putative SOS response-associated peptidase YedK